jgi:O-acetyl-ADP-ribose deacetylase (regulator of RNase III)
MESMSIPQDPPQQQQQQHPFGSKLKLLAKALVKDDEKKIAAEIYALAGSMLDFHGHCCVNCSNEGGITGFGIDELVNKAAGGFVLKEARRSLGGIPTGMAKYTQSYQHDAVQYIIHTTGPVFRDNALDKDTSLDTKQDQLRSAYHNTMKVASALRCDSIGFALISAGVFRGSVPLETILKIGLEGILAFYAHPEAADLSEVGGQIDGTSDQVFVPTQIALCAFTLEEQEALTKVVSSLA